MSEHAATTHRIHLRGPWQAVWCDESGWPVDAAVRLRHPEDWPAFAGQRTGRVLLERMFHSPTNIESGESVFIVLTGISGVGEVKLNGQSLGQFDDSQIACEFAIPLPLPFSNSLSIEVSFVAATPERAEVGLFGVVALEIRGANGASAKRR